MSTFFVTYDLADGRILRSGMCQRECVSLQAGDGEAAIETDFPYPDTDFKVDLATGQVVEKGNN